MFLLRHKIPHRRRSNSPLLGSQDISARERTAIGAGVWKFLTAASQDVIKNAGAKQVVIPGFARTLTQPINKRLRTHNLPDELLHA